MAEKQKWMDIVAWVDREAERTKFLAENEEIRKKRSEVQIDDALLTWYNPVCKHERCSWDIINCAACMEYSKTLRAALREKKAEEDNAE